MFTVRSSGFVHTNLKAAEASLKARELRQAGASDVEIFREDDSRISQYALDQIVRCET